VVTLATTKMSSKGQVVIPEEIRTLMKLKAVRNSSWSAKMM